MQVVEWDGYSAPHSHSGTQVPSIWWFSILYSFGVLCVILYLAADAGREEDLREILRGQAFHPRSTAPSSLPMFHWPELSHIVT